MGGGVKSLQKHLKIHSRKCETILKILRLFAIVAIAQWVQAQPERLVLATSFLGPMSYRLCMKQCMIGQNNKCRKNWTCSQSEMLLSSFLPFISTVAQSHLNIKLLTTQFCNTEMEDNITASTMLFSSFQINTSEMYIREEMVLLKRYNLNHFPHLVRQQIHINSLKS